MHRPHHRIDNPTSMYDELEDNHDNGTEILVVSNLDARIELEFSMYKTYKVTRSLILKKMKSLQR
jgi:hypothetical protein